MARPWAHGVARSEFQGPSQGRTEQVETPTYAAQAADVGPHGPQGGAQGGAMRRGGEALVES
jgi:hypothetical protein